MADFDLFAGGFSEHPATASPVIRLASGLRDLAAHGIELAAIMQAVRWKSPAMVARYTERLTPQREAVAKLATLQNRA